ncbi:hypothetical protein C3V36_09320 [Lachnospiraceae bacterium oral taxon 500]|nr:hypothetical protein C3V36_09320 [Lachnospiraceae bacterium oral taxon 500]
MFKILGFISCFFQFVSVRKRKSGILLLNSPFFSVYQANNINSKVQYLSDYSGGHQTSRYLCRTLSVKTLLSGRISSNICLSAVKYISILA